jgi:hypothetical protein
MLPVIRRMIELLNVSILPPTSSLPQIVRWEAIKQQYLFSALSHAIVESVI